MPVFKLFVWFLIDAALILFVVASSIVEALVLLLKLIWRLIQLCYYAGRYSYRLIVDGFNNWIDKKFDELF